MSSLSHSRAFFDLSNHHSNANTNPNQVSGIKDSSSPSLDPSDKQRLSLEIWYKEILPRLEYEDLKKMESLNVGFRNAIHQDLRLRMKLFRTPVSEEMLSVIFQLLGHRGTLSPTVLSNGSHRYFDRLPSRIQDVRDGFQAIVHPYLLQSNLIQYFVTRMQDRPTHSSIGIWSNGLDLSQVGHFKEKILFELSSHPIGRESASQFSVGWFRFDFEAAHLSHKGTSPQSIDQPQSSEIPAVTVYDVVKTLIKLKGEESLAGWFGIDAMRIEIQEHGSLLERQSVFSLQEGLKARYVKGILNEGGETIGVEFYQAELETVSETVHSSLRLTQQDLRSRDTPTFASPSPAKEHRRLSTSAAQQRNLTWSEPQGSMLVAGESLGKDQSEQVAEASLRSCFNCSTTSTSLWRKDNHSHLLCNACALYLKLHNVSRPKSMRNDTIKRRNRSASRASSSSQSSRSRSLLRTTEHERGESNDSGYFSSRTSPLALRPSPIGQMAPSRETAGNDQDAAMSLLELQYGSQE